MCTHCFVWLAHFLRATAVPAGTAENTCRLRPVANKIGLNAIVWPTHCRPLGLSIDAKAITVEHYCSFKKKYIDKNMKLHTG